MRHTRTLSGITAVFAFSVFAVACNPGPQRVVSPADTEEAPSSDTEADTGPGEMDAELMDSAEDGGADGEAMDVGADGGETDGATADTNGDTASDTSGPPGDASGEVGTSCTDNDQCASKVCTDGTCQPPSCSDGVQNGQEQDVDCGGPDCAPCGDMPECTDDSQCSPGVCVGSGDERACQPCRNGETRKTSNKCGYQNRGRVEQKCANHQWTRNGCVDVWWKSCRELSKARPGASSGTYRIDPDGASGNKFSAFQAECDMSTDGGGWTVITPCIAQKELNGTMVAEDKASSAQIDPKCRPWTTDMDKHTYHYTFEFPPGFEEFYLDSFKSRGNHGDVDGGQINPRFKQTTWKKAWQRTRPGSSGGTGDISFGSAAFPGPETSYARELSSKMKCQYCEFSWPSGTKRYKFSKKVQTFRIGWGEIGPDSEGWYPWWKGTIRIR